MGILEDINNMKNQGAQDKDILKKLQDKGASPKAIEDAFNQLRIKKAVSAEATGEDGMEPSIMKAGAPQLYTPKTQEIEHDSESFYSPQPTPPLPQQYNEEPQAPAYGDYNQEEYTPQEGYVEQGVGGGSDTDTIIEIAEQVFSEKIKREQKQIESLNEFATLAEAKISNDHERIKRIEEIMDKLQIAILEKIGSYGRNLDSIKNEMGMMQESFEKMVPEVHERSTNNNNNRNKRTYENQRQQEEQETPEEESEEELPLPPVAVKKKVPKVKN
jgi:hypothetical protein